MFPLIRVRKFDEFGQRLVPLRYRVIINPNYIALPVPCCFSICVRYYTKVFRRLVLIRLRVILNPLYIK